MPGLKRIGTIACLVVYISSVLMLVGLTSSWAGVYSWQDESGNWHFSDTPPPDVPVQYSPEVSTDKIGTAPSPPGGTAAPSRALPSGGDTATAVSNQPPESLHGGMLWRIQRGSTPPSHLLGTIHSSDPRIVRLRPAVVQALDQADRFIMEMIIDGPAQMEMGATMIFTDGNDLATVLGPELYKRVINAMSGSGMPEMVIRTLKPWAVMAMLSMPKPSSDPILDLVLHQRAINAGKPAAGLESAQEQLSIFDGLTLNEQTSLLKMTLDQLPVLPKMMQHLLQAYINDDLGQIVQIEKQYEDQNSGAVTKKFYHRLNTSRNLRMVKRMQTYLQQGNSFIAVGALHLAGPEGLIALLRQKGYTVSSIR